MVEMGDQYATRWEPAGASDGSAMGFGDADTVAGDVFARTCVEAMAGRRSAERELRSRMLLGGMQNREVVGRRVNQHNGYQPNLSMQRGRKTNGRS